jgi:ankyrin repeat protein
LFAAAGIANSAPLTRCLLDASANVDEEVLPRAADAAPESHEHFQAWLDQHPLEALYHASEFKDVTCLRLLLEAEPALPAVTYCLSRALDFDNEKAALLYLKHGADAAHVVPWHQQRSHLHKAVMNHRGPKLIRALLAGGADPNLPDAQGLSPYRLAVRRGAHEMAQILQENGGDPATITPSDRAAPPDPDLLIRAARRGDLAELERWLNAGADLHRALDMAPIHGACYAGQLDAARLLLDRGASLVQKNAYGGTALSTCIYGSTDCHDEEGGPSARLPEEVPPRGYAELTELLIQRGASLPSAITGGSDAVQDVLRRHGVPD